LSAAGKTFRDPGTLPGNVQVDEIAMEKEKTRISIQKGVCGVAACCLDS
jgi:hypothetical protein